MSRSSKVSRNSNKNRAEKKSSNKPVIIGLCALVAILLISVIMLASKKDNPPENRTDIGNPQPNGNGLANNQLSPDNKRNHNNNWESSKHRLNGKQFLDALSKELSRTSNTPVQIQDYRFEGGKITALDLNGNRGLKSLKPLRDLDTLNYLNISNCTSLRSLDGLQGTELYELNLASSEPMSLNSLRGIEGLPLHVVKIENCRNLRNIEPLLRTNIEDLEILNSDMSKHELMKLSSIDFKVLKLDDRELERAILENRPHGPRHNEFFT